MTRRCAEPCTGDAVEPRPGTTGTLVEGDRARATSGDRGASMMRRKHESGRCRSGVGRLPVGGGVAARRGRGGCRSGMRRLPVGGGAAAGRGWGGFPLGAGRLPVGGGAAAGSGRGGCHVGCPAAAGWVCGG